MTRDYEIHKTGDRVVTKRAEDHQYRFVPSPTENKEEQRLMLSVLDGDGNPVVEVPYCELSDLRIDYNDD